MSVSFVCLFRGTSIDKARLVASSTNNDLVQQVAAAILKTDPQPDSTDLVLHALGQGRRQALRLMIQKEGAV